MADPTYKGPLLAATVQRGLCSPSSAGILQRVTPHIRSVDTVDTDDRDPGLYLISQELFAPTPPHAFPPPASCVVPVDLTFTSQVLGKQACATIPGSLSAGDGT